MPKKSNLVIFLIVLPFLLMSSFYVIYNKNISFKEGDYIEVLPGDSLNNVIDYLEDKFLFQHGFRLKVIMKFLSLEDDIKPGKHSLSNINSVKDLVKEITAVTSYESLTLLEGWTIDDISSYLKKSKNLYFFNADVFRKLCYDKDFIDTEIIEGLGFYNIDNLEGYLFPETYLVDSYTNEKELIKIFVQQFQSKLRTYYRDIDDIKKTMIIASIVEAETNLVDEMDTISSIYHNRIKNNMKLESDPTIEYVINRPMKSKDKFIDSPFNTYRNKGLPPSPINSPGLEAIKAAIYPAETGFLFMVMNYKKGRHLFATNYKQHKINIRK